MTLPITVPRIDQFGTRRIAGVGGVDMPSIGITTDRLAGPTGGKLARRIALPVCILSTDRADLNRAVALGGGAESGTRLDRLQLLGIANQPNLGALLLSFGPDTHQLARPDPNTGNASGRDRACPNM